LQRKKIALNGNLSRTATFSSGSILMVVFVSDFIRLAKIYFFKHKANSDHSLEEHLVTAQNLHR